MSPVKHSSDFLASRMRENTEIIHNRVEKRVFLQNLAKGKVSKELYCQYLVDLKHIYEGLEKKLDQNCSHKATGQLCIPTLYRTKNLEEDIKALGIKNLKPGDKAQEYCKYLENIEQDKSHLLVAHAFTRYLGDLFGGQLLYKKVDKMWKGVTAFYTFEVPSCRKFAQKICKILNTLPLSGTQQNEIVKEAYKAFEFADKMLASLE